MSDDASFIKSQMHSEGSSDGGSGGGGDAVTGTIDSVDLKVDGLSNVINLKSASSVKGIMERGYRAGKSLFDYLLNRVLGKMTKDQSIFDDIKNDKPSLKRETIITKVRPTIYSPGGGH